MVVVMDGQTSDVDVEKLVDKLESLEFEIQIIRGERRIVLAIIGDTKNLDSFPFYAYTGVKEVLQVAKPYKLASREFKSTSTYSFQGLGLEGLKLMARAGKEYGLLVITEVMSIEQIDVIAEYADIFQIGARNMQNFMLLKELGRIKKPVMLKRGISTTLEELLLSAEYILSQGNDEVMLCERGIRTFENYTRNTLDLSAVPSLKELSHLPIIVDPSHSTGRWKLVGPMAKSAIAAGADGILIEVHPNPKASLSDGAQTLKLKNFSKLMMELNAVAHAVDREINLTGNVD